MRSYIAVGVALAASVTGAVAGSTAIKFLGLPQSATYSKPQTLADDGSCPMAPYTYSGSVSPFDEELSMVFRGPIQISHIAVYTQQAGSKIKRSRHAHQRRHGHLHDQMEVKRDAEANTEAGAELEERQEVVATINGQVVSWVNNYHPDATPAPATPAQPAPVKAAMGEVEQKAPAPQVTTNVGAGNWARTAFYEASSGTATGLSFLQNNNWGPLYKIYGAVLGYVTSNGQAQAGQPQILENTLLPDNTEIIVSSDQACNNGDCGAIAPGANAHHGFAGANKIFMAEYTMPLSGSQSGLNPDMPAFWMLNTQIVNTVQYAACSCWATGCGEFDVHEVLQSGATAGYATLHGGNNFQGQAPGAIDRPTSGTIKIAAAVAAGQVSVHVLPADFSFDSSLSSSVISGILNSPDMEEFTVVK